jgi:hypothetical protein
MNQSCMDRYAESILQTPIAERQILSGTEFAAPNNRFNRYARQNRGIPAIAVNDLPILRRIRLWLMDFSETHHERGAENGPIS